MPSVIKPNPALAGQMQYLYACLTNSLKNNTMRLIIVSNRAPVNVKKNGGDYVFEDSAGGLASGLRAYVQNANGNKPADMQVIWIGWPGITVQENEKEELKKSIMEKSGVYSVFLSEEMMEKFYEGFCNKTIWPLFHYFTGFTVYEREYWDQYVAVNKIFCNAVCEVAQPGDMIWVQDYQLMLLPGMLRKEMPAAEIGFFLHIPFPSYEVFRLLPSNWRHEILEGLYGADLIGFHTHDYRTYFLQSTLRILGVDDQMGEVYYHDRMVRVDTFPMGIDYRKYHDAVFSPEVEKEKLKLNDSLPHLKLVLSIDRQDYTKGILNRLNGYEHFLENYPEWRQKVTMILVVVPSRIGVENYQSVKNQIDGLIGKINGQFGSLEWMPIIYQYRSLGYNELIALYALSDIALITPLRDGMNLIAKEYVATRTNIDGTLILSEMAGAAEELDESIIINPNNVEEISAALNAALQMGPEEQNRRIGIMQQRIADYNVFTWASDFISTLDNVKKKQERLKAKILMGGNRAKLVEQFKKAAARILFLDYVGTLIPFTPRPTDAQPGRNLKEKLKKLTTINNTQVVLISGRDKRTMDNWFGDLNIDMAAEHGILVKEKGDDWQLLKPVRVNWKRKILPVLKHFAERLPGALVEDKEYSAVFHYRRSDPEFASLRVKELMNYLVSYTSNMDLQLLNGNRAVEVRSAGIDKGIAALYWLAKLKKKRSSFILCVGDDVTDEDLFKAMPRNAFSIKVGLHPSYAMYNVISPFEVLNLLDDFLS
jgi:trehalose 6-phosphate synthase/phosphatase